jgi:Cdc6-like AAA superfamily ATPase
MGFRFRRTLTIIPGIRLNLSRSGPSVSLGMRGLHYTVGAKGTRMTAGLPGSGLSWTSYQPYVAGRRSETSQPHPPSPDNSVPPRSADPVATNFQSAPIEELVSGSTSELAPVLDAARKQWRFHPIVLALAVAAFALAVFSNSPPAAVGAIVFGVIAWPSMFFCDRYRLTINLDYNFQDSEIERFNELVHTFEKLMRCHRVWRIPQQIAVTDWKRNAGVGYSVSRQPISLGIGLPKLIRSNLKFPVIPVGKQSIYFTPDAILVVAEKSVAALAYDQLEVVARTIRFTEADAPPSDATVVGKTWQYVNKNGGPDQRFSNNHQLPVCLYGEIDLQSSNGLNERFQCSQAEAASQFASFVTAMRSQLTLQRPERSAEIQRLQSARESFLETKADFDRRLTKNADLAKRAHWEEQMFAVTMMAMLCWVASADGPINSSETDAINLLLGIKQDQAFYVELMNKWKDSDRLELFGNAIQLAFLIGREEKGVDYDEQHEPLLKCIDTLGQALLSADGDVNPTEIKALSEFTVFAHKKLAEIIQQHQPQNEPPPINTPQNAHKTPASAPPLTLEKCIAELEALVGLASVKVEVETLTNLARTFTLRKEKDLPVPEVSFHMIFSGNPGTGKTTVARIVAKIYGCLGLLSKGHLVEVDRSGLVGGFVGQTAIKTQSVIDQAKGGILFIDEAYSLAKDSENDFGHEAIEVMLKSMEDYRDDLVIIAAGYTDRMSKFLDSNPGLRSRFPRTVIFPDYSAEELEEIFRREADHNQYRLDASAGPALHVAIDRLWQQRGPEFANAREIRNFFERVVEEQANRISASKQITTEALTTLMDTDVRKASA